MSRRRCGGAPGFSLLESLMALLLTSLLVPLAWALVASARGAALRVVERSEALEVERTGWHVLSSEVGSGLPGRDWTVDRPRVLSLRAFRGVAEVCEPPSAAGEALVRHSGLRLADPTKDSLLVLTAEGAWEVARLVTRAPVTGRCPGWAEPLERWRWEPEIGSAVLLRVFERGSYHLEDRAFRYRAGDGGRQPLTPERLHDAGSAFERTGSVLELRLSVHAEPGTLWASIRRLSLEALPDG
jgi:hypothetical protein